jgi:hypothetical protein
MAWFDLKFNIRQMPLGNISNNHHFGNGYLKDFISTFRTKAVTSPQPVLIAALAAKTAIFP